MEVLLAITLGMLVAFPIGVCFGFHAAELERWLRSVREGENK